MAFTAKRQDLWRITVRIARSDGSFASVGHQRASEAVTDRLLWAIHDGANNSGLPPDHIAATEVVVCPVGGLGLGPCAR